MEKPFGTEAHVRVDSATEEIEQIVLHLPSPVENSIWMNITELDLRIYLLTPGKSSYGAALKI